MTRVRAADVVERLRDKAKFFRGSCEWPATADAFAEAADEIEKLRAALLALSQPDGFVRATIKEDRQARIDYARAALGEPKP